jgi:transposase InsO family protein
MIPTPPPNNHWIVDSGASAHITPHHHIITDITPCHDTFITADGVQHRATHSGTASLSLQSGTPLRLQNVRLVPSLTHNLISVTELNKSNIDVTFGAECILSERTTGKIITTGHRHGNVFILPMSSSVPQRPLPCLTTLSTTDRIYAAHNQLGHTSVSKLKLLAKQGLLPNIAPKDFTNFSLQCNSCAVTKQKRLPFPAHDHRIYDRRLQMVVADVWGPFPEPTLRGDRYSITFTDVYTRRRWIYILQSKSQAFEAFRIFKATVENDSGDSIKALRTDNGGEFCSKAFETFLASHGIHHETTVPHTPEQNGIAERSNGTISVMTSTLMHSSKLPLTLWDYACRHSVFVANRIPHAAHTNGLSPYEKWHGHPPDLSVMHPFGCLVFAGIPRVDRPNKLSPTAQPGYFVGVSTRSKGFLVYLPDSNKVITSRDVTFRPGQMYTPSPSVKNLPPAGSYPVALPPSNFQSLQAPPPEQTAHPNSVTAGEDQNGHVQDDDDFVSFIDDSESVSLDPTISTDETSPEPTANDDAYVPPRAPAIHADEPPPAHVPEDNAEHAHAPDVHAPFLHFPEYESVYHDFQLTSAKSGPRAEKQTRALGERLRILRHRISEQDRAQSEMATSGEHHRTLETPSVPVGEPIDPVVQNEQVVHNEEPLLSLTNVIPPANVAKATDKASDIPIPSSYKEAMASAYKDRWMEAMAEEYGSLINAKTWDLVELPPDRQAIPCMHIYTVKSDENGLLLRFKSRLVAKGYKQIHGIDYHDTYAPVAKIATIRLLCAIAAHNDLHLHQMDVKTAFLNGDLQEEIYMKQPPGFIEPGKEHLVCRLNRSLYGLKQSPRAWYQKLDTFLLSIHMKRSAVDHSLYVHHTPEFFLAVAVYVDDLLIVANSDAALRTFKSHMTSRFEMKDLGEVRHILGIRVTRDKPSGTLTLDQGTYIESILDRFSMTNCNPAAVPMTPGFKTPKTDASPDETAHMESVPYRQLIGSLLYAATCTRPDIAFAVSYLSRYLSAPRSCHWTAAKHILRYLRGTTTFGITYRRNTGPPTLSGYADAAYADCNHTHRSTGGFIFLLANGPISWKSGRQRLVAKSTAEAEYISLAEACSEATWLRNLLTDLNITQQKPTTIFEDNQSCINMVKNGHFNARNKHIAVKYHFTREKWETGEIDIQYIPTASMLADTLTKPLPRDTFDTCSRNIGLQSPSLSGSPTTNRGSPTTNSGSCENSCSLSPKSGSTNNPHRQALLNILLAS